MDANRTNQNYDGRITRRETVELTAKKMLEQWKKFLDGQFSEDPSKIKGGEQKGDMPTAIGFRMNEEFQRISLGQIQAEEETLVLKMIDKLFDPALKILNSSQYFYYPEVTKEIEKVQRELKKHFPNYFSPTKNTVKVETRIGTLSNNIRRKNMENKERKGKIENKMKSTFDSMWNSEFQTLKSMAEKVSPEPIEWTPDCEKLYNHHFDSLVKSIASSTSPGYDQELQKECREMSLKMTEGVCTATKSTCLFINEYSETMYLELNNSICFPVESDFTQVHENTIIYIYNKIYSPTVVNKFQTAWDQLDHLTKVALLEYEKKFRLQNQESRREQAEIAAKAKDFALTKYNTFMNNATSQEPGIFKASEILSFHNKAYQKIKTCFNGIPGFKYTLSWEKSWEKLDREMKELEKNYLDKNQQKLENKNLQRKNRMAAAENEYRSFMNNSISLKSHGKSIELTELERFHAEGVKRALELYEKKMDGVQGDVKKYKEALISKFLDMRQQLMHENAEKVAREIMEKKEQKVKQREPEPEWQKERQLQKIRESQQQKLQSQKLIQSQNISKITIKNSPFNSNQEKSNPKPNVSNSSTTEFKGGIAFHFSKEGINIGSRQKSRLILIAKNLPPSIIFTQTQIFIGDETVVLSASTSASGFNPSHDPTIFKFSLFDLLQDEKNEGQKLIINGKQDLLRTEEILAIFFHKIVHVIQNVHSDFHPSRSFVEFVISPFLPLPMKQKLRIGLNLAGFNRSRTHLLQSTMSMALSYFHNNHQKLEEKEKSHGLVVIHNSEEYCDVAVVKGCDHSIKSIYQTGRPFLPAESSNSFWKATTKFRDNISSIFFSNITNSQSTNEKSLENLLKSVLNPDNVNRKDVDSVMAVVKHERLNTEKVAGTVFGKEIQVMNEMDGILRGAAVLAGWKAGLPFFSPQFKIQEILPYHLEFHFHSKNDPGGIKKQVIKRHEQYHNEKCIAFLEIPLDISASRDFGLWENTENGGHFVSSYKVDENAIFPGRRIRFEISSQGHIEARWADNQNPIMAEHSWLNCEEEENANRKLKKIFSTIVSLRSACHSSSLTTPASSSSFSTSTSTSVSARKEISMSKESSSNTSKPVSVPMKTPISKISSAENLNPPMEEKCKEKENLAQNRSELESLVQEVKGQLEKSQGTSKLMRDQIEELIQEIDKVLNSTEPVEAALLRSYGEKLKIRAKRIK